MNKTAVIYAAVTVALGAVGAVLHHIQMNTILEAGTGLAQRMAPITLCLAAVSVLAVVIFLGMIFLIKDRDVEPVYHTALASRSVLSLIVSILLAIIVLLGAVFCWQNGAGIHSRGLLSRLLAVFAALSAVSVVVLALAGYRGKSGSEAMLASFVIVLFICLYLIIFYKENAADPVLVKFVYDYLGVCAAALSGYYLAGYAFGRSKPRATVFFSAAGAYLCLTALAGTDSMVFRLFYLFMIGYQLMGLALLCSNLKDKAVLVTQEEAAPPCEEE